MKRVKKRRVNNLWSWLWDMSWTFGVDVTLPRVILKPSHASSELFLPSACILVTAVLFFSWPWVMYGFHYLLIYLGCSLCRFWCCAVSGSFPGVESEHVDELHVFLLVCGLRSVKDPLYLVEAFSGIPRKELWYIHIYHSIPNMSFYTQTGSLHNLFSFHVCLQIVSLSVVTPFLFL